MLSKAERRYVTKTDLKKCWYGSFPPTLTLPKKIPNFVLPRWTQQAALTQFYSSVEFSVNAYNGYIVVAPKRKQDTE
jgi:hypothetical protein